MCTEWNAMQASTQEHRCRLTILCALLIAATGWPTVDAFADKHRQNSHRPTADRESRSSLRESDAAQTLLTAKPLSLSPDELIQLVNQTQSFPVPTTFHDPRVDKPVARLDLEADLLKNRIYCQSQYHFRHDGGVDQQFWSIVRVVDRDDVARQSQVTVDWTPWLEQQPTIRARVISPSGEVLPLEDSQIVDQLAPGEADDVISDQRQTIAMLSGVEPGSLVEVVWNRSTRAMLSGIGTGKTCSLADFDPWRVFHVKITSDANTRWALAPSAPR